MKHLTEAVLIPVACIAVALVFVVSTQGYPSFEAVKYPYTIAFAVIVIFSIIAIREIKSRRETGNLSGSDATTLDDDALQPPSPGAKWNPLWLVLLTFVYAALFPILNTIAATFVYITCLRIALKKFSVLAMLFDILGVVGVFMLFGGIFKIDLPMGVLEDAIIARIFM